MSPSQLLPAAHPETADPIDINNHRITAESNTEGYQYAVVIQADAWPLRRLCPVSIYLAGIAFDLAVFGVPPISQ